MARYMTFERQSSYRGVMLVRYNHLSHASEWELKTYVADDGTEIQYHTSEAYGPYAKRGQAKGQINRELVYKVGRKEVESVHAFTEESVIEWGNIDHLPVEHP